MRRLPLLTLALALTAACAPRDPAPGGRPTAQDSAHVEAMRREHAGHTPVPSGAVTEPSRSVVDGEVVYGTVDGRPLRGYMARPEAPIVGQRLPAILVIHEWWGLNENVKTMTRRLAAEGYVALAVDMFGGTVATTPEQARTLTAGVMANREAGVRNLAEAAKWARAQGAPKLATLGWCFGGGWSLGAALAMPEQVDASVMFYGQVVTDRERLARLDAPLLGIFGEADRGIPVAQVREMEAALKSLGKNVEVVVYPGAGHGFANPSGQSYDATAADDAWRRTVTFLRRHLHGV